MYNIDFKSKGTLDIGISKNIILLITILIVNNICPPVIHICGFLYFIVI